MPIASATVRTSGAPVVTTAVHVVPPEGCILEPDQVVGPGEHAVLGLCDDRAVAVADPAQDRPHRRVREQLQARVGDPTHVVEHVEGHADRRQVGRCQQQQVGELRRRHAVDRREVVPGPTRPTRSYGATGTDRTRGSGLGVELMTTSTTPSRRPCHIAENGSGTNRRSIRGSVRRTRLTRRGHSGIGGPSTRPGDATRTMVAPAAVRASSTAAASVAG